MPVLDPNEAFFTAFEPKQGNRFIMYLEGIPTFMIYAANRPKYTSADVTLNHINVQRKIKGKSTWNDIQITLYDPVTPSGAQASMEWIRLSHESVTGRDGYSDFYKKNVTFNALGPVTDVVEEWILKGAYPKESTFSDFDWNNDSEVANVQLTLRYDYAILNY